METKALGSSASAGGEAGLETARLTAADVAEVAAQARLRFSDEELEALSEQLSAVLSMAAELHAVDTAGVEPTMHGFPLSNVLRDDAPWRSLRREDVFAGAPEQQDGYFKVPRILEES